VIAQGLDSPRHLAFGSDGDLFVAEAGRGGTDLQFDGGEGPATMGASGAVTKIDRRGRQTRIATGLASYANVGENPDAPTFENAIGPHGITVLGDDGVIITNGGPTEPKVNGTTVDREYLANGHPYADLFGRVLAIGKRGRVLKLADIYDFERDNNPDAEAGNPAVDSNPVDVAVDGFKLVVADAGGNAVDVVKPYNRVSALTIFKNLDAGPQAVPTSVVIGPDHQYYVSLLTGFPFLPEASTIYKVDPRTGAQTPVSTGLTNMMDLAFGRNGTLYALSIDDNGLLAEGNEGAIYAIDRAGNRTKLALPAGTLPMPGGITATNDALFVTINSGSPGNGQVIRISLR
jgi:glucose/arabinose dehydrogenase